MKGGGLSWKKFGITKKFSLVFFIFLILYVAITSTWYFSLQLIRDAEEDITNSMAIEQLVLVMDRSMEKARRLHGDFFLHYQSIGLSSAHELYAQKSVREIAKAIESSSKLKTMLSQSEVSKTLTKNEVDIILYLSSARRFADTSIEAVELITRRAAPERGLEAKLKIVSESLRTELQDYPVLKSMYEKALSLYKDYQVSRHRFLMQSSFNTLNHIEESIIRNTSFAEGKKSYVVELLAEFRQLAVQLLDVDRAIKGKFHDFSLQAQVVAHIPSALLGAMRSEVGEAELRIQHIHWLVGCIMLSITFIGLVVLLIIARVMNESITKNILRLTAAARELMRGNMDVSVPRMSQDELGQLANIFNKMVSRLKSLVENLEEEVEIRTSELSASEQRFRNLANDLPRIAVQGCDSERRVIFWNNACQAIYGYSEDEAMGRKLEDLTVPEPLRSTVVERIHNWFENNIPISSAEMTLQHKDGQDVVVYSSNVMFKGHNGEKELYIVDIDLAELKLAQEKGRQSEFIYRQLFDQSSSGIAVYDAVDEGDDFVFKDFNRAGEEIEKVTRQAVLGQRVTEVFPVVEETGLLEVFRQVWQTGEPAHHPISFYKDGQLWGCRENRIYKLPSGEIVAVYNDTTAQKRVEEEKKVVENRLQRAQKMEAIAVLAGGVAHDLNNILSGIVGYPELILFQLPEDSELRSSIEAIKESGERAAAVVADLLTVARGVASSKKKASLNTLVLEYLDSPEFRKLKQAHPAVLLSMQLAEESPHIECSTVHVKKCIMNLVMNAAEAINGKGEVALSTRIHTPEEDWARDRDLKPGEYAVLRVSDNGIGIPQKDIEHIFEPFYTKKIMGKSGTGLGLAVVWNTVEDHNGSVVVESNDEVTFFDLYFPATEKTVLAQPEKTEENKLSGRGEKILVVDDEELQRDIAKKMLTQLGYSVICNASGEDAVSYLQEKEVDLVLLDMIMDPGINGRQTYQQIVAMYPGQKAIIVSGFSESEDVRKACQLGARGFLKKPYNMAQLDKVVRDELDR